jgi:hypothetical protein
MYQEEVMKNQLKIFLIFPILLILIYCMPDSSKKAKEQNEKNYLLSIAQFLVFREFIEQSYLKIVSTQPENGTNIVSAQAITITFNKDVSGCSLSQVQPTSQTLTNIIINGKNVTINPPSGSWGSSGQILKISGGCTSIDRIYTAISLNYTIN